MTTKAENKKENIPLYYHYDRFDMAIINQLYWLEKLKETEKILNKDN